MVCLLCSMPLTDGRPCPNCDPPTRDEAPPEWAAMAMRLQAERKRKATLQARVRRLTEQLRHGNPEVRETAAVDLGVIGPDAEEAIGSLSTALRDSDTFVSLAAARALRRIRRCDDVSDDFGHIDIEMLVAEPSGLRR